MPEIENDQYFLITGNADKERLTILNKLYNPSALDFLKFNGIKEGMTILEIGCGTGDMACALAKLVGPKGKIIAIDSSTSQIKVAKETAEKAGIFNVEFHICNIFDLDQLGVQYDVTYGRWVIEFAKNPESALSIMYQYLKPGGVLAYESSNIRQTDYFTYPYHHAVEKWHEVAPKIFIKNGFPLEFGNKIHSIFQKLGCKKIKMRAVQAILKTKEEKKVYRLGLISCTPGALKHNIMTDNEISILKKELEELENTDIICGFYKNILIGGIKE